MRQKQLEYLQLDKIKELDFIYHFVSYDNVNTSFGVQHSKGNVNASKIRNISDVNASKIRNISDVNASKIRNISDVNATSAQHPLDVNATSAQHPLDANPRSLNYKTEDGGLLDKGCHVTIEGKDSLVPGIMNKTVDMIEILQKEGITYDFMLRTTIATCIDFPALLEFLQDQEPPKYIGPSGILRWIDTGLGIVNRSYWGTQYVGGNFTILSGDLALQMAKEKDTLIYTISDDVAMGYFVKQSTNTIPLDISHKICFRKQIDYKGELLPDVIAYFNNNFKQERQVDVNNFCEVTDMLINKYRSD
jgi:hypothetical protein